MQEIKPVDDLGSSVAGSQQPGSIAGVDALDTLDLTNVDIQRKVIKDGSTVEVGIHHMEVVPVKDKSKDYQVLNITFRTKTPAESREVDDNGARFTIRPGYSITERIPLKPPTEEYNYQERLAKMQVCFLGEKGKWNAAAMKAATGNVRVGVEVDKDGVYPDKNRIVAFLPKVTEQVAQPK